MAHSLAEQLKRLAVPQTLQLKHSDRFRVSFLFDPKEAANLERSTAYCLGLNGLEELILIDEDFKSYENTLFSESSQMFERSVQTKEINKKLDDVISDFLFRLSPYVLLRPAHKALEWLVYRYHIHLYNDDDLVRCFLPFHGTNVFVRAIQMINLRGRKTKWEWLESVQTSGVPLAKSAIVNYAERNLDFLAFICELVGPIMQGGDENAKKYQVIVSFYSSTIVSLIRQCKKEKRHDLLTVILPYILNGLRSSILDVQCSSFMFISQLAIKNVMKPKLFETFVKSVVKVIKDNVSTEAIMCLLVLYQTQKYEAIPQKCLLRLQILDEFVNTLCELDRDFYLTPFIHPILIGCVVLMGDKTALTKTKLKKIKEEDKSKIIFKLFKKIVLNLKLDGDLVRATIRKLIEVHLDKCISKIMTAKILCQFETKYPDIFDEVLETFLERASESERNVIQNVLTTSTNVGKQKRSTKLYGTSLYLNLNHPNKGRRKAALDKLLQRIRDHKEKNEQFVSEALQARLHDDFHQIPMAIFGEFKTIYHFIPTWTLFDAMKVILDKHGEFVELNMLVLNAMCSEEFVSNMSDEELDKVIVFLIPYIFPTSSQTLESASLLMKSYLLKTHKLFIGLSDLSNVNLAACFEELTEFVGCKLMELDTDSRFKFITMLIEQCTIRSKSIVQSRFVITSLLKHLIPLHLKDESIKLSSLLTELCTQCLKLKRMLHCKLTGDNTDLKSYLEIVQDNRLPVAYLTDSLTVVINSISIPELLKQNYWWSTCVDENPLLSLLIEVFNLFTEQASCEENLQQQTLFRTLLGDFIVKIFKNTHLFVRFLTVLWVAHTQPTAESFLKISLVMQARSLSIAKNVFQTAKLEFLNELNNPSIALLLVALAEAPQPLLVLILDCFEAISSRDSVNQLTYKPLVNRLVKNRAEIEMDLDQLPLIVSKVLKRNEVILDILFGIIGSKTASEFVKANLLQSLRFTNSQKSLPLVCELAEDLFRHDKLTESQGKIIEHILIRFSPEVISSAPQQVKIVEIFKLSLNSKLELPHTKTLCRFVLLNLITKELFNSFNQSNQQALFDAIVEFKVSNEDPELTDMVNKILKKIVSESVHVITVLRNLLNTLPQLQLAIRASKKRRVESILKENAKESKSEVEQWKYVCCVLETLQTKKKIKNLPDLIPLLFDLLDRCLKLEDQSSAELRKQLILTCIHHCCSKLSSDSSNERYVKIDLVVSCLRASKDKQTHNNALLLLTLMANMFPQSVLLNVMAIFTFMGTNMLRQDDYYSFEIMARTTKAVVPAMLASNETSGGQNKLVFDVLDIFVGAFPDMPVHRRRAIFSHLLDSLNPELFLGTTLALLLKLNVTKKRVEPDQPGVKSTRNKDISSALIKFALALAASYSPFIQLKACEELFHILAQLPIEKDERLFKPCGAVFDVISLKPHEFRNFQFNCVTFVASVVGSQMFTEQISEIREVQPKEFETSCKILLEQILHFSNRVALSSESNSAKTLEKFWKTLLHRTYEVLDKVNALLPGSLFVSVISSLMDSKLSIVRRKAMELLNSRLQFHPDALQESEVRSLAVLIDPLLQQVKDVENSDSSLTNHQVALLSLKMLCRSFGSHQSSQLIPVLEVVISSFIRNIEHDVICGSALLCLVEVCACLGAFAIGSLQTFMPYVLDIFSKHSRLLSQELLLMSVISSVLRLVETLSHFLSPYLPDLIEQICIISTNEICNQKPAINSKLIALRHKLSTMVPTRVLLPAITKCYEDLITLKSTQSLSTLMSILAECIVTMDKETRASNLNTLQSFFLHILDYRSQHPEGDVAGLEESLFEPVLALVMKLSESNFRPLFYKIYNWASQAEAPKERSITFYHLTDKIVDKLKSLFHMFAGHFVQNAASLLNANKSKDDMMFDSETECCILVNFILQTFHKIFLYDKEGFVNKERFDTLVTPLVDQIGNQMVEVEYEDRITKLLAPCLGQLAEATADEANWKTLNYQILLKTRHNSPKVRLGALQCLSELNRHLEKDYLSLLPDTVPFLAEMMEDESTEVEQKCQTVIAAMEITLGESIQKYF
uniref:HEAT repeat-containing protein 1 n=1 Tax=Strigamia maritima TaxID=126957 RepID=T1J0A3_STRMM